jgi:hypothetical protein
MAAAAVSSGDDARMNVPDRRSSERATETQLPPGGFGPDRDLSGAARFMPLDGHIQHYRLFMSSSALVKICAQGQIRAQRPAIFAALCRLRRRLTPPIVATLRISGDEGSVQIGIPRTSADNVRVPIRTMSEQRLHRTLLEPYFTARSMRRSGTNQTSATRI